MAAVFGDTEDIAVYSADIHLDHNTHELYVDEHGQQQTRRIATGEEDANTYETTEKKDVAHVDKV